MIPASHVDDALSLEADGEVYLYEVHPLTGGVLYIKNDDSVTWQGNEYEGLPISFSGDKQSSDGSAPTPRLMIGQEDLDLLPFKGLMHDGHLDGARIKRTRVLVDDIIADRNIKYDRQFRVKRVEGYSRTKISLVLAAASVATPQTLPFRQFIPPDFPWVDLTGN